MPVSCRVHTYIHWLFGKERKVFRCLMILQSSYFIYPVKALRYMLEIPSVPIPRTCFLSVLLFFCSVGSPCHYRKTFSISYSRITSLTDRAELPFVLRFPLQLFSPLTDFYCSAIQITFKNIFLVLHGSSSEETIKDEEERRNKRK